MYYITELFSVQVAKLFYYLHLRCIRNNEGTSSFTQAPSVADLVLAARCLPWARFVTEFITGEMKLNKTILIYRRLPVSQFINIPNVYTRTVSILRPFFQWSHLTVMWLRSNLRLIQVRLLFQGVSFWRVTVIQVFEWKCLKYFFLIDTAVYCLKNEAKKNLYYTFLFLKYILPVVTFHFLAEWEAWVSTFNFRAW